MKKFVIGAVLFGTAAVAHADPAPIRGSDTLFGALTDAINQAGLQADLQYLGGGSGLGESGLRTGTQGIAPMSRALSAAAIEDLLNQGVTPVQSVIGLDGVAVFVKADDLALQVDIPTLRAIFTCQITDWANVPGSSQTGTIAVYRRNDDSGTTDTFKTLVGVTTFGACVTPLATTADMAEVTSTDPLAIGYAGLSGERPGANRPLAVGRTAEGPFVAPATDTIRDFSYPLARRLYVNSVTDGRFPSAAEQALLDVVVDRSFMDPIILANEFVTCLPDEEGGCP
jgi:phosphate transport system substrate-binding protein